MSTKYLDPKNDLAFKKIFGQEKHKSIPISFLNAVFNLTGEDEIIDLDFLEGTQLPEIQARKESIVDVLVRDRKGIKYVIEMQVSKVLGFEKRAQFYAAKTYCSHFNIGGDYVDLKKVIFLAITSYIAFPDKEDYKSDHVILDRKTYENDLKDFSFTFVELPKFEKKSNELKTLEDKWYYFLKHAEESNTIKAALSKSAEIRAAYGVLERIHWSERELREYDAIAMAAADARGALMAAKLDGEKIGEERGLVKGEEIGLVKGEEIGLVKGEEIGQKKERVELAIKLLSKGFPDDEVAQLTELTLEEVQSLKKR